MLFRRGDLPPPPLERSDDRGLGQEPARPARDSEAGKYARWLEQLLSNSRDSCEDYNELTGECSILDEPYKP